MTRILIAEDETRIASFIDKGLRSHGFATTVATTVCDFANVAQGNNFNLMILDLGLPEKEVMF